MPITKRRRHQRGVKKSRRVKKVRRSRKGRKSIGHRTRKMNKRGGLFSSKSSRMTETKKPISGIQLNDLIYTTDEFTIPYFGLPYKTIRKHLNYSDERIKQLFKEDIEQLNNESRTNRFVKLIQLLDARSREKRTTAYSRREGPIK